MITQKSEVSVLAAQLGKHTRRNSGTRMLGVAADRASERNSLEEAASGTIFSLQEGSGQEREGGGGRIESSR